MTTYIDFLKSKMALSTQSGFEIQTDEIRNNFTKNFITVFCETGWEHPLTYKYIEGVRDALGLNLVVL
jgi:3'-phosphoadenosine 5'-phosphosulfate sulfotransferase (PAPS reductase)/FAD synthetase